MGNRSRIVGTGSSLPSRAVSNDELSRWVGVAPDAIFRKTGIKTRYWASEDQSPSQLAEEAAHRALSAAGIPADSLDVILVSTTSPDMIFPSTACHLQRRLGVAGAAAFDVAASCSGFLYSLSMADALVRAGMARRCLVVSTEIKSRFLDYRDQSTAMLFGDGAGAAVVVAEQDGAGTPSGAGILGVRLHADGSQYGLIDIPAGGSKLPASPTTVKNGLHTIRIQGGPLFRIAIKRVAEAVRETMQETRITIEQVARVIFHQANGRMLTALERKCLLPPGKMYSVIEGVGNISSAGLPLALDRAVREGSIQSGDLVLLGAFGGGLTWGTALMRW